MTKLIVGLFLGLLIGLSVMVAAQSPTTGSGTGAAIPGNTQLQTGSGSASPTASMLLAIDPNASAKFSGPTSFIFGGRSGRELLVIHQDGRVIFQGRLLGTDKEVWDGLRAVMSPSQACQEWEEDMRWLKP